MPKICYVPKKFTKAHQDLIETVNGIVAEYESMGFELTLRQLYYQLVSRDVIANDQKEYKRLSGIVSEARLAGLIDWNRITDLTRELRGLNHWDSPEDIIAGCAHQFRVDKWDDQKFRVEVWVEKDALRNVVNRACVELDVDYFSCRGYTSQSEMWGAAQRMIGYEECKQKPVILHIGDHDPSGIDMTRDIKDRFKLFGAKVKVERLALNMNQIEEFNPPPNPAKVTDARYSRYASKFGEDCWELDALAPDVLVEIIQSNIRRYLNQKKYDAHLREEERERENIGLVSSNFRECVERIRMGEDE